MAEDKLEQNADAAAGESRPASKEVKVAVTPEMVEAGKLAIDESSGNKTQSLANSVEKIYVAMAAQDQDALREKENVAQLKQDKRINIWLYFGIIVIFILGCVLIAKIIVSLLS